MITSKEKLEEFVVENWNAINLYIDEEMQGLPISFYNSVDIRESRHKVAPVDNNIYPAGFNNLCALDLDASARIIKKEIHRLAPKAARVVIIPESHTKNTFYLDHLAILGKTVRDAGFEVIFGSLDPQLFGNGEDGLDLISHSHFDIRINHLKIQDGFLVDDSGHFDFAILNHDQSNPLPVKWEEVKTPVHPTPLIGWYQRQKAIHFCYYAKVVEKFSQKFGIDPDLIQAKFQRVDDVDFSARSGLEKVGQAVDDMVKQSEPGVSIFVKASQGTYGMGISVVSSGAEIVQMNKKVRNKMDIGKNNIKFTTVLVQEGIETILKYDEMPAEVTIYMIGGKSVGGFMRANSEKNSKSNLNSKGMVFRKFCISEIRQNEDHKCKEALYTIIARLSAIASGLEIADVL